MKKKHEKSGYFTTSLVVGIVLVAAYVAGFWYVKAKVENATYELSKAEIEYEQKDLVHERSSVIRELEPDIQKIESYYVGADDVVGFINLLEQKASEQNVAIETKDVSIDAGESLVYGEIVGVSFTVKGDWNNVMQYINLVETLPYNIQTKSVNLTLEENDEVELKDGEEAVFHWEANITLQVLKHEKV